MFRQALLLLALNLAVAQVPAAAQAAGTSGGGKSATADSKRAAGVKPIADGFELTDFESGDYQSHEQKVIEAKKAAPKAGDADKAALEKSVSVKAQPENKSQQVGKAAQNSQPKPDKSVAVKAPSVAPPPVTKMNDAAPASQIQGKQIADESKPAEQSAAAESKPVEQPVAAGSGNGAQQQFPAPASPYVQQPATHTPYQQPFVPPGAPYYPQQPFVSPGAHYQQQQAVSPGVTYQQQQFGTPQYAPFQRPQWMGQTAPYPQQPYAPQMAPYPQQQYAPAPYPQQQYAPAPYPQQQYGAQAAPFQRPQWSGPPGQYSQQPMASGMTSYPQQPYGVQTAPYYQQQQTYAAPPAPFQRPLWTGPPPPYSAQRFAAPQYQQPFTSYSQAYQQPPVANQNTPIQPPPGSRQAYPGNSLSYRSQTATGPWAPSAYGSGSDDGRQKQPATSSQGAARSPNAADSQSETGKAGTGNGNRPDAQANPAGAAKQPATEDTKDSAGKKTTGDSPASGDQNTSAGSQPSGDTTTTADSQPSGDKTTTADSPASGEKTTADTQSAGGQPTTAGSRSKSGRQTTADSQDADKSNWLSLTEAREYMLSLINRDRQSSGLKPVELDKVATIAGQAHSDDMALSKYVSHWDLLGRKPNQRYSDAGGQGAVAENVALNRGFVDGQSYKLDAVQRFRKADLDQIQSLFFNEVPPNDGHRRNILDAAHNRVGIGLTLAQPGNRVTCTQEFVNQYGSFSNLPTRNSLANALSLEGKLENGLTIYAVDIYREDSPQALKRDQIKVPVPYSYPTESVAHYFPPPYKSPTPIKITKTDGGRETFSVEVKPGEDWKPGLYYVIVWAKKPDSSTPILCCTHTVDLVAAADAEPTATP